METSTVYPRWRGEHPVGCVYGRHYRGLSPLARGTQIQLGKFDYASRFIPAGAGNTTKKASASPRNAVYPRWRGEHLCDRRPECYRDGLSPLARGTHDAVSYAVDFHRFIPAGAGNTGNSARRFCATAVYPRWRGEHRKNRFQFTRRNGLSPLARGTLNFGAIRTGTTRFIPAGAGNTMAWRLTFSARPVYPRWRGEHASARRNIPAHAGLSPLARGTHLPELSPPNKFRFIPAGAGNTGFWPGLRRCRAVYPRWRGEHSRRNNRQRIAVGLSPLARGTRSIQRSSASAHRFIPAGAGNTTYKRAVAGGDAVYPRWRGEHTFSHPLQTVLHGLSPLARGTL